MNMAAASGPTMSKTNGLSFGVHNPMLTFLRPGYMPACGHSGKRLLLTVCVHGNEPCGLHAVNQLLQEGYFRTDDSGDWHFKWDSLTILLGNPLALQKGKRFVDNNLNRLFCKEHIAKRTNDPGYGYEHSRVKLIAAAIEDCNEYLDVHSTSAPTKPFAFHSSHPESRAYAATMPVDYTVEDAMGNDWNISTYWAEECGVRAATCVECGQHDDPQTTAVARRVIERFVSCKPAKAKTAVVCRQGELVRRGFRLVRDVQAWQWVPHGEVVATDDEVGDMRCNVQPGAYIVMPTKLPVTGEDAWMWGEAVEQQDGC